MARSTPPRFVARSFIATLVVVAFVVTAVFVVITPGSMDALPRRLLQSMAAIALGAFVLAAIASLWLARTISRPIDRLSQSLNEMTRTRTFDRPLVASGVSRELDALTDAFNTMIGAIQTAEAETRHACLEAVRALAMALDARDPYRAGHSERVSALSVAIGRQMQLEDGTVEVLRLGALLHDIGKVGVNDNLLRKASPLTPDEYEAIKTHPIAGSRILKGVRLLEPHLPLVELHHERPDGGGYPYGLKGDEIPITARIVRAADAYDAMTTTRAYRPALSKAAARAELQRCAGTGFDAGVVAALMTVLAQGNASVEEVPLAVEAEGFGSEAELPAAKPQRDGGRNPLDDFDSEGQVA